MAKLGIIVETDLGIEHQQLPLVIDGQRVDLNLRGIGAHERLVKASKDLARLLGEVAGEPERSRHFAAVVRH